MKTSVILITNLFKSLPFLFLIISLTLISPVRAQSFLQGIKIGDRVRIYAPAMSYQRMAGTVTEISSSYIRLAMDKETKTIYSKFIEQLDISRGIMRHTGEGALIGATTGGVFFGMFLGLSSGSGNGGLFSNESMTLIGVSFGLVTGGLLGALIGSKSRDRWERIPVKVTMGPLLIQSNYIALNTGITLRFSLNK